ncbi:MAG: general secretion pathway protein GspK [Deltaproteobacteria bacterium]|nr:general secretion pathway protein GspK [Deltaproteobacteria bacterium]
MRRRENHGRQGSILIVVLWVLLLISLLAGRYLSHNRGKAAAAAYGWKSLVREQAFFSVLELYATSGQPLPPDSEIEEIKPAEGNANNEQAGETAPLSWRSLTVGGFSLLVRESSEGKRINLNSAADDAIRKQLRQGLGEDHQEEADQVTDALLDWRDPDDLVRSDGAEKDFYQQQSLAYEPADGPFKALTEMLLVRGVTPELFWGTTPPADSMDIENPPFSLINAFTITGKNVKRVEVVFPPDDGNAVAFTAFLQRKNQKWVLLRCYRCYLTVAEKEEKIESKR